MRRRDFIKVIGGTVAWPLTARAQQPAMPVVGVLNVASPDGYRPMVAAFRQGLKESGYVEDRNVAIEFHWAGGRTDRLPAIAAELVHRKVSVIAATSTPAALAARAAITTIPIVFETGGDPVKLGLVVSLNRPGGSVTGVSQLNAETAPKRLQILHEMVPTATSVALLLNPTNPAPAELILRSSQAAERRRPGPAPARWRRLRRRKPNPASRPTIICRRIPTPCIGAISASF